LNNPNGSEDNWEANKYLDMKRNNGSEHSETLYLGTVSAAPNVFGLNQPIRRSRKMVEKAFQTVNVMETRRNKRM
jgi:hypothetical protein